MSKGPLQPTAPIRAANAATPQRGCSRHESGVGRHECGVHGVRQTALILVVPCTVHVAYKRQATSSAALCLRLWVHMKIYVGRISGVTAAATEAARSGCGEGGWVAGVTARRYGRGRRRRPHQQPPAPP
eukprot:CAMPEP_0182571708 /NCGR_PEP_ID=MMETSP1324-20130603/14416_1 /TAXON_ID=236786 /ORGANISM="Florenciella sp., Strain RCC1587" /LENGTH=128 /DNA_ID=CAMNT_0024786395 /DNA_START=20 /DNA_END=404 /DNA_ORIENTATION=-